MADFRLAFRDPELRRMISFLAAGMVNTAFGYALFALFVLLGAGAGLALAAATAAGVAFSYQTFRRFVFRGAGNGVRFVALYAGLFALNWAALEILHGLGMPDLASQALLVPPFAALSFFGQRKFVFGRAAIAIAGEC